MPSPIARALRALTLALLLALGPAASAMGQAPREAIPPEWDAAIAEAGALTAEADAATPELELARDRLLRLRSAAIEFETAAAGRLADVNARLQALGPPPAEPGTSEIDERRAQVGAELSLAQVPVLEAQDFQRRADALIRDIDRMVRARFAAQLRSHGPTPLRPRHWVETVEAVAQHLARVEGEIGDALSDPVNRTVILRRVPLDLVLAIFGIAITFALRRHLAALIEGALSRATDLRAIAMLVSLRNISRLIVPAVGVGLLFAALDPARLTDPAAEGRLFLLPGFALALIGAGWLGGALFSPGLPAYRLLPIDEAAAAVGTRVTLGLGVVLAARLFLLRYVSEWALTPAQAATLAFPLILAGGVLMWRAARLIGVLRREVLLRERAGQAGERTGGAGHLMLGLLERGAMLVAVTAPLLSAAGYLAAANYLLYASILTLGLIGAATVALDLLVKAFGAIADRTGEPARDFANDGLAPVLAAMLVLFAAAPFLALIWGARVSDISGIWFTMRDGVTFGGMRISIGMVATFALVFGLIYALSRMLQSLLRGTVLPRTSMDAGGKNAVLTGVGYVGFFIAAVAAVSSTGIDLTSLAFVAGALSVGIGFGLQNIVSNFVSGIILLVERPIKEGDWIEVGEHMGYVRGISVRSTEIETFDRASVILPNSDLIAGAVLNRTHTGMSGRLSIPIGVSYASDPRHVERILNDIADDHPMVLLDPAPRVVFMGFGSDSLNFEIRCWLRDVNFSLSARSDINFEIHARFKAEGIGIPFPQRVLHFEPAALRDASDPGQAGAGAPPDGATAD